jgi:hypothetical protein
MEHGRHELVHDDGDRPGPIGHHLGRLAVILERPGKETSGGARVAAG